MPYDSSGIYYDGDDYEASQNCYPCDVCGGFEYCDEETHKHHDEIYAHLDNEICELKCSCCGERLWTRMHVLDIDASLLWSCEASCGNFCGIPYTIFLSDDDHYLFHIDSVNDAWQAKFRSVFPMSDRGEIPF